MKNQINLKECENDFKKILDKVLGGQQNNCRKILVVIRTITLEKMKANLNVI